VPTSHTGLDRNFGETATVPPVEVSTRRKAAVGGGSGYAGKLPPAPGTIGTISIFTTVL
jgi:hypothetical protein